MSEKIHDMFEIAEALPTDYKNRPRPADLVAFNLLNQLFPDHADMVSAAEHDEIWLAVTGEELEASSITQEQVNTLVQCGVHWDSCIDCLHMFV